MTTLRTGPGQLPAGKELRGEERELLDTVSRPLLDALEVEEAEALEAAPGRLGAPHGRETDEAGAARHQHRASI